MVEREGSPVRPFACRDDSECRDLVMIPFVAEIYAAFCEASTYDSYVPAKLSAIWSARLP